MGVPKFFRYISERYPCLSEVAREQCIPEFDNLYLDMNGIIHNCSHPDDNNIHFNITEEDMFKDIFNYIDKLFFLIKPQKLFFMAVDGVAPRAKMNQQRSRRFRSAKEAELLELKAKNRGEKIEHERFDSNCITPGTEFMSRLHEALRYFIKSKISTDPMWQKCRIILSGHDCPGEGEHKIMDYIRYLKSRSDYDLNTRHCMYGLDADLIILGLCTHEPHFVILREEVKFGRKTKKTSVEETRFFLLHLGLLREYLEMEFYDLRMKDNNFDISKIIDDWILMGFLVGNDFIPHLPCLHISSNALPLLYKTYIKVYPKLCGNINENGKLNLDRLEQYLTALSEVEFELFQENYADLKYFEAKQSKNGVDEAFDFDTNEISKENVDTDLSAFIESSRQFFEDDDDNLSDENQHIVDEFETYKRDYYLKKLNQNEMSSEQKKKQAVCYITALQWILDYYYRGVQSWEWYYPHHYAPFISDLKNFKDIKIEFSMGKPFLPFEQLLAVLPAASKQLLPPAYRHLMTSSNSELIHFYPSNFETDLNGKKHEWEAVVLIPFIDQHLLLDAIKSCDSNLTPSELKRNKHGPMLQFDYNTESQGTTPGIYSLKTLYNVFCTEKPIWSKDIVVPNNAIIKSIENSYARTKFFPGFPTMKHLEYDFQIKFARVKVFDQPSRNENLILLPKKRPDFNDVVRVSEKFLNQVVYIGWPHLIKAQVIGISSKDKYISSNGIEDMDPKLFQHQFKTAQEHLTTRMGIEFSDFSVMVHVKTHVGTTYICGSNGKVIINDVWSPNVTVYPAQGVVSEINVHSSVQHQHRYVESLFPVNSKIFFVGNPYFGSEGIVLNPLLVYECGRLKVNITVLPEPDFTEAKNVHYKLESDYVNSYEASAIIGINSKSLGRITGTVLVIAGERRSNLVENITKTNIGLQFKFPKQNEQRVGYARRINNQWFYSSKAIALIHSYCKKFPMVIDYLSKSSDRNEFCFEADLFPENIGQNSIQDIVSWLKEQDHIKADRVISGSKTVNKEAIEEILESIEKLKSLPVKTVKLQVKPHLLLKPDVSLPYMYKSEKHIRLFDRVVIVRTTYMVPLGSKGTVVGIYPVSDPNPIRLECVKVIEHFFEVLFDKNLPNGNDIHGIAQGRVYKVPESSVLLIINQGSRQVDHMSNCTTGQNVKTTSYYTSNSKPAEEIDKYQSALHENLLTNKITNRGHEDFWMPSANTKVTYLDKPSLNNTFYEAVDRTSKDTKSPIQPTATLKNIEVPNEYQAKTEKLKNLLGLAENNPTTTHQSIKSEQMKVCKNLPKPPSNWRDKSKEYLTNDSNHNFGPSSFGNQQQESSVAQCSGSADVNSGHHNQMYKKNNTYYRQQNIFNLESLNQKGAFTPLHGSNYHTFQALSNSGNVQGIEQSIQNVSLNEPSVSSDISTIQRLNVEATTKRSREETRKKAPRIPKIGAKFDHAH